jgi:hypothetical protein
MNKSGKSETELEEVVENDLRELRVKTWRLKASSREE